MYQSDDCTNQGTKLYSHCYYPTNIPIQYKCMYIHMHCTQLYVCYIHTYTYVRMYEHYTGICTYLKPVKKALLFNPQELANLKMIEHLHSHIEQCPDGGSMQCTYTYVSTVRMHVMLV